MFDVHTPIFTEVSGDPPGSHEVLVKPRAIDLSAVKANPATAQIIDYHIGQVSVHLQDAIAASGTNRYYTLWSQAIEEGLLEASGVPGAKRAPCRGRGQVNIQVKSPSWVKPVQLQPAKGGIDEQAPATGKLLVLQRCCMHLAGLAGSIKPERGDMPCEGFPCWRAICKRAQRLWHLAPPLPEWHAGTHWSQLVVAARLAA